MVSGRAEAPDRRGAELRAAVLDRAAGPQITTPAALAVLGTVEPRPTGRVRTALRLGTSREAVVEVLVHLAPCAGTLRALAALRCARAAFSADGGADT